MVGVVSPALSRDLGPAFARGRRSSHDACLDDLNAFRGFCQAMRRDLSVAVGGHKHDQSGAARLQSEGNQPGMLTLQQG
jgi:hypothetical protein